MGVNPRPTYTSDIKYLINSNYSSVIEYKIKQRGPNDKMLQPNKSFNQQFNNQLN